MDSKYTGYDWPEQDKKQVLPTLFKDIMAEPRSKILDLGCGSGWITTKLGEFADYVLGVDNDPYMIERAKNENTRNNVEYQLRDMRDVEGIRSNFDLAVSTLAMQMLSSQEDLEKMFGGVSAKELIMVVPHPFSIDKNESYSKYRFPKEFEYHDGGSYEVWLDNGNEGISFSSRHVPLKHYINAIANSDFQINELKEHGGHRFPYFLQLNLVKKQEQVLERGDVK